MQNIAIWPYKDARENVAIDELLYAAAAGGACVPTGGPAMRSVHAHCSAVRGRPNFGRQTAKLRDTRLGAVLETVGKRAGRGHGVCKPFVD